jgi:Uma2 family endonuclease
MSQRPDAWIVDPDDPRAPPMEIWERMTEAERQRVVDELPSEFPASEARPPEGDPHTEAVYDARTALRRFFGQTRRGIYVGTNLPVYYPGEAMFSPDVLAVLDVPAHPRSSWMVAKEGKGLDLALEILVLGHRRKDTVRNVAYYASLGIKEYFVFDRPRLRLAGYRLREGERTYQQLVPQHGRFESQTLGLSLGVEQERLRFYVGDAAIPAAPDLIEKLEGFVDDMEARLAAAERRAEEEGERAEELARRLATETQRAEDEKRRAEDAERRLREALAEVERLRGGG